MNVPASCLPDRVDIVSRDRYALGGTMRTAERVLARNVRCAIGSSISYRFPDLFGTPIEGKELRALFGRTPRIEEGYRLRVVGQETEYVVQAVHRHPAPHRFDYQLVDIALDSARVRA